VVNVGRYVSSLPELNLLFYCLGLVNPKCVGIIGSGVVVHVPSFFKELDSLQQKGKFSDRFSNLFSILIMSTPYRT
jgi:adenylosuccinate synthase